jgi:hypothetical protein
VSGPRIQPSGETNRLRAVRAAAKVAVAALLDVPLPPEPRRAVQALQAALEANP